MAAKEPLVIDLVENGEWLGVFKGFEPVGGGLKKLKVKKASTTKSGMFGNNVEVTPFVVDPDKDIETVTRDSDARDIKIVYPHPDGDIVNGHNKVDADHTPYNQIMFLEEDLQDIKTERDRLRKENAKLKKQLEKYAEDDGEESSSGSNNGANMFTCPECGDKNSAKDLHSMKGYCPSCNNDVMNDPRSDYNGAV